MKLLTLALLLAGFAMSTVSAADHEHEQHMREKCRKAGGSIKENGECRGKKGHMQAYDIKK